MSDIAAQKAVARQHAFAQRRVAHTADSGAGAGLLSGLLAGYRGVPLAGYMPIRTEIDPRPAMEEAAAHGPVGVPVIAAVAHPLRFALWAPDMEMTEGPFGARIPADPQYFEPEILIVPIVAFDRTGARLGYGGGFYDRTLMHLRARRATLAVGFAYAAQEVEGLPLEHTDQSLDYIVTEHAVLQISRDADTRG